LQLERAVPLFPNEIISENEGCKIMLPKVDNMRTGKRPREMIIVIVGSLKQESRDEKRAPWVINVESS
jgi:hypothetical protein